jgi:streptogramin lyase
MTGIGVDNQGNVYIADFDNVRVQKFDSTGKFLLQWPTERPIGPVGVAVDQQGSVYVALHRTHDHYVQKFDSNGMLLSAWGSSGSEDGQFGAGSHSGPTNVTVDFQGKVWVADPDNHRIQVFDSNGIFLEKWTRVEGYRPNQFLKPTSVEVDNQGNVYVGDCCRIQKFDSHGNFLVQWLVIGTVDNQGNIYAIDANKHTLTKFQQPAP